MPSPHRHLSVDELSQRASTGLAIRRGEIKISDPIPSSYVHNSVQIEGAYEQPQPTPTLEGTWPRGSGVATTTSQARHNGSQPTHISRFTERTSLGPSLAASSNMSSTPSKDSSLQRRNTGFRATIRRMFGSKKGKNIAMQPTGAEQQTFSRSQSMGLNQQSSAFQPSPLHFSTVSPSRALNSHAPSPHLRGESENLMRPQPSLGQFAARRNTEPSLLMVQLEQQASEAEPVTARLHSEVVEQEDAKRVSQEEDKEDTKRSFERPRTAIRRNTPPPAQFKRRSRSADALADLLRSPPPKPSNRRDRAEEIAFWRNSIVINPLPPLPNPEQFRLVDPVEDRKVSPSSEASAPTRPSIEPIQDFDFGLNESSTSAMPATLQERVNTLEVKLYDFEFALAKLQGIDVTRPNLPKKPSRRKSLRDVFPESGDSSAQESSSGNDLSYVSSRSDQWAPTTPRENLRADRTSKATTIKPTHGRIASKSSQISSPSSIRFTREEYDALRTLIEGEKSARQQLEIQVMNLQKEVEILKSPVYAYIQPAKYPTPSPDSCHEQTVLATPRLRHFPATRPERDLNETSRFSMTETEPDTDGDQNYPEIYETPKESEFHFEPRRVSPPGMI